MNGNSIKCASCGGCGIVQNRNVYDPSPEECDRCAGSGAQWRYSKGAIAKYRGGPLVDKEPVVKGFIG
jgi:DnaJ-class molecular chaperone